MEKSHSSGMQFLLAVRRRDAGQEQYDTASNGCLYVHRQKFFTSLYGSRGRSDIKKRDREREDERGPRVEWIASSSLRMMEYVLSARPEK
jgi:hypothetical protein